MKKNNQKKSISIPLKPLLLTSLPEISKQSKETVKKLQVPSQVNSNQKEMDRISNEMAVLFEKKITARKLAEWLAVVSQHEDNPQGVREFIWGLGYSLLPKFIECDTKIKKIEYLKENIVGLFSFMMHKDELSEALGAIGVKYATNFKRLRSDAECVEDFMKTYTTFLCVFEMYHDYEFYKGELEKETKKVA